MIVITRLPLALRERAGLTTDVPEVCGAAHVPRCTLGPWPLRLRSMSCHSSAFEVTASLLASSLPHWQWR